MLQIKGNNLVKDTKDAWVSKENESLVFTIKLAYRILRNEASGKQRRLYELF